MHAFWIALGGVVLVAGLLDLFLTALNYDEAGFLATRLCKLQWRCIRSITRRLSRRWRPFALRQVTGLQIMLSVVTWLGCVVVGFGFIYYGLMEGANFRYDGRGLGDGMFSALYLSAAQLATVGTSQISPQTNVLRVLTIAETLSGLVLVTLILTFLLGVYQVVRDLRSLAANFAAVESDFGSAVASLGPYFPQGRPVGLDSYLQAISDSFWSYSDGLRLHHIAYYFQSGRDQFSLPYALHMVVTTLAALRWGLPSGLACLEPVLARLIPQYESFADYLHQELHWTSIAVPELVTFEEFAAAQRDPSRAADTWLGRFLRLNRDMAQLARLDPDGDQQEAYERYQSWLPFAYRAQQVTAAVWRDLDYQPLTQGREPALIGASQDREAAATAGSPAVRGMASPVRALLTRWVAVPDPGLTRLASGARATFAAAATVVTLYALFSLAGVPVLPAAMFGGMVGMFATTMPKDVTAADRKLTTALMVLPALAAAALGGVVASMFAYGGGVILVAVALLAVWASGFGPRFGALGQMTFMAYYFTQLVHLPVSQFPAIAAAAVAGTIWAYAFGFVLIAARPDRVLRGGLDSFRARLVMMLDPLIDAVSGARWDPGISKQASATSRQLHRTASFLQGQLRVADLPALGMPTRPRELRLLVFDAELAADNVIDAARSVARAGAAVPIQLRRQLAGMLDQAQDRLRSSYSNGASRTSALAAPAPSGDLEREGHRSGACPGIARRLQDAIGELVRADTAICSAQSAALADPRVAADEVTTETDLQALQRDPISAEEPSGDKSFAPWWSMPTSRLAIQAAVATGLALAAGAVVTSSERQYWAALAAFLVLSGTSTVEETRLKGFERVIGTVSGAIVGFGVAVFTGADPVVVLPLVAVCIFAATYLQPVSNALPAFWTTMMLALLYEFLGTLTQETLPVRVLETAVGAVIALGVSTFILPIRTRKKMNADAVALLETLNDIIQTCLKRQVSGSDMSSLADRALVLDQRFRQLSAGAEPLRRVSGAMGPEGIERQLTSAAALTYYARQLIKTAEATAPRAPLLATEAAKELGTATKDNIAVLTRVLEGQPPGPTHGGEDLPLEPGGASGSQEDASPLHYLERINQTVLTLIEDLTPGIADYAAE